MTIIRHCINLSWKLESLLPQTVANFPWGFVQGIDNGEFISSCASSAFAAKTYCSLRKNAKFHTQNTAEADGKWQIACQKLSESQRYPHKIVDK